ncbi:hypothetical protein [Nitrosomonas sp.]|uniref:hypothetical protein n=1 Tax=Nitrosomonas sp. TaxID=42353 RepID=UPI0032EB9747
MLGIHTGNISAGEEYFRHQLPIYPSQMTRFRNRIGVEGCDMLNITVVAGVATQTAAKKSLSEVIVDTTVPHLHLLLQLSFICHYFNFCGFNSPLLGKEAG